MIRVDVLPAGKRAAGLPENTAALPMMMWVKGALKADARTGEKATVVTAIGREVEGVVTNCDPGYVHDYGRYVPELAKVHRQVVDIVNGKEAC